jgi:hypothetical protein
MASGAPNTDFLVIDITTIAQAVTLRLLRDRMEARMVTAGAIRGYPLAGTDDGAGSHVPPAASVTIHWAELILHPTIASRACLIVGPLMGAFLNAEIAACAAAVLAGNATTAQKAIANLPVAAPPDSSWDATLSGP